MQMSEIEKNTYTMPVMVDRTVYTSKPGSDLVGRIKTSMEKNGVVYMTMRQVCDALTSGQSIIPAGLDGGMKSESWREQSLFLVDFDGGVSLAEARERYEDAGLPPAFAYHTFSHSEACEKFRLAFVMDDAVRNGSARDKIMATLIGLSGGAADAKCIDRARYFNGTNKGGEFYGDIIEVSDVLSFWDDSYSSLLPSKAAKEKSATARKNGRKPSGRSYEMEVSGNIIPFSTWYWRINARPNLAMLNRFFELRRWVEGDHRERFAFIYYNQAKLICGADEALALVEEKVAQMEQPLSKAEFYWAINHTEIHEETNMPELHGDGVFLFNRETIAGEDWLDMTVEEEESCGIFRTREKNARADRNRDVKRERDELVASLLEEGKTPREIKEVLDEQYGELSLSIRSIQRLCARSKEGCDKIPLTIKNITPFLPQPTQTTEANGNEGCEIVPIHTNTLNPSQKSAFDAILNSKHNILLSGVAGSGKSHVMKNAIEQLEASGRSVAVCAATGMAASHFPYASTFHRLFHMDADGYIYKEGDAMAELADYDVVFVDEASMLKASHMDSAINLLRETKKRYHKAPRLVLCFDILQLPPVDGGYFFEARNFGSLNFERHYLLENMRQTDDIPFTRVLNFLRVGENVAPCCRYLNAMCSHVEDQDAVYLYAKRWRADAKNCEILRRLPGEEIDLGNLVAKVGCEVIVTENSRYGNANQYYNGQRGVLEQVQQNRVCVRTMDGELVWLYKKFLWDSNGHPVVDNDGHHLKGYPLSLAYAVTIHKSQGMTLDSANIDPDCFAAGQLYVALSRVRSLDGVHLLRNLREQDCKVSDSALAFDSWMRSESKRAAV